MSNNISTHEQHPAQRAREARLGLAADLRDIQQVGGRLIRTSEQRLKSSAILLGIAVIGGLFVGLAIGRATKRTSRFSSSASTDSGLLRKAVAAIGARVATQVVSKLLNAAVSRAEPSV